MCSGGEEDHTNSGFSTPIGEQTQEHLHEINETSEVSFGVADDASRTVQQEAKVDSRCTN